MVENVRVSATAGGVSGGFIRLCIAFLAYSDFHQLHIAACTLIFDAISSEGIVTREALRQIESYCFVMEIARSVQPALEALSPNHVDTHCGILQDLVVRVEGLVRLIPVDLLERLICLMTSVICFAADTDHAETQLRLLRIIDSSVHADAEWAIDFMLLHFQGEPCFVRPRQL